MCHNPSLGLVTKARGYKVEGKEGDSGIKSHVPGSEKNVKEWILTLPSELPCWELKSQMDSQIFRVQFQGSKPIGSEKNLYHWKMIET